MAYRFESGRRYYLFFREADDALPVFRWIFFELLCVAMEVRGDLICRILGEAGVHGTKRSHEIAFFKKLVVTSGLLDEKSFEALDDNARAEITQTALDQVGAQREGNLVPGYILEQGQLPGGDGAPEEIGDDP